MILDKVSSLEAKYGDIFKRVEWYMKESNEWYWLILSHELGSYGTGWEIKKALSESLQRRWSSFISSKWIVSKSKKYWGKYRIVLNQEYILNNIEHQVQKAMLIGYEKNIPTFWSGLDHGWQVMIDKNKLSQENIAIFEELKETDSKLDIVINDEDIRVWFHCISDSDLEERSIYLFNLLAPQEYYSLDSHKWVLEHINHIAQEKNQLRMKMGYTSLWKAEIVSESIENRARYIDRDEDIIYAWNVEEEYRKMNKWETLTDVKREKCLEESILNLYKLINDNQQ